MQYYIHAERLADALIEEFGAEEDAFIHDVSMLTAGYLSPTEDLSAYEVLYLYFAQVLPQKIKDDRNCPNQVPFHILYDEDGQVCLRDVETDLYGVAKTPEGDTVYSTGFGTVTVLP